MRKQIRYQFANTCCCMLRTVFNRIFIGGIRKTRLTGMASGCSESPEGALKAAGVSVDNPAKVDEAQWRKILPPEVYHVARESGTEAPFTGKYDKHMKPGMYHCVCCGAELFSSDTKFNSGCGWPAFNSAKTNDAINENIVRLTDDSIPGYERVEVRCRKCQAHLGHVFDDGPKPTGERFCINSVCLAFAPNTIKPADEKN